MGLVRTYIDSAEINHINQKIDTYHHKGSEIEFRQDHGPPKEPDSQDSIYCI